MNQRLGMRVIKKCQTIIYRLKKYCDAGIPRYFVTSSMVDNFWKTQPCKSSAVLSPDGIPRYLASPRYTVTFNTAIFFWYRYTSHPYQRRNNNFRALSRAQTSATVSLITYDPNPELSKFNHLCFWSVLYVFSKFREISPVNILSYPANKQTDKHVSKRYPAKLWRTW